MRRIILLIRIIILLSFVGAIGFLGVYRLGQNAVFPTLSVKTPDGVSLQYYNTRVSDNTQCNYILSRLEEAIQGSCPTCEKVGKTCAAELPPSQWIYFTDTPVSKPIAHLPQGVMLFDSLDMDLSKRACDETVRLLNDNHTTHKTKCVYPETSHAYFKPLGSGVNVRSVGHALIVGLIAFSACFMAVLFILRYENLHSRYSHDHLDAGPQKFHAVATPRIGGVALGVGIVSGALALNLLEPEFSVKDYSFLLLAAIPAFGGGLVEDLTKRVGVGARLALTMLSGFLGSLLLGATLSSTGIGPLDFMLQWYPFSLLFTAFAVGGIANAMNIIDGCNGLASGVGFIVSLALAYISGVNGDAFLCTCNLAMAGTLIGFYLWNWPWGKIFLGDGGAYFLGFWLAEMSVLLVVGNPAVSVWFPFLLLILPIFETLFSVYRRKFLHKAHPGMPDARHLHQMIYKRMVRIGVGSRSSDTKTMRNSGVAPYYLLPLVVISSIGACFFYRSSILLFLILMFCCLYVVAYRLMFRWRIPAWLQKVKLTGQ